MKRATKSIEFWLLIVAFALATPFAAKHPKGSYMEGPVVSLSKK